MPPLVPSDGGRHAATPLHAVDAASSAAVWPQSSSASQPTGTNLPTQDCGGSAAPPRNARPCEGTSAPLTQEPESADPSRGSADRPPGVLDAPVHAPCQSHMWHPTPRHSNLSWRAPPAEAPEPAPARPEGDKLIHVRVPTNRQRRGHRGQRMAAIELCCGHAGLTAALRDHGLEAAGVDWARNKHQPWCRSSTST